MKGQILVTDTLFIMDEHVKQLEDAGYEVVRVEKPDMTEEELTEAVKGKAGYILGGIEYVTDKVIDAADDLKAIVFTGTGFKGHIPGWERAKEKGIKVGNTPYANVYEVAEWAVAATMAMQRDLFDLGPQGKTRFHTITSLPDLTVGVVGLGHIGKQYADMMKGLGAKGVQYWSREKKDNGYKHVSKENLFATSDIVFVSVADDAGADFIGTNDLESMKKDALLVSIAHHGIINEDALAEAVTGGHIRAAIDIIKKQELFKDASPERWYASSSSAAYNSWTFLKRASDMAVETLLNLLEKGEDKNSVF